MKSNDTMIADFVKIFAFLLVLSKLGSAVPNNVDKDPGYIGAHMKKPLIFISPLQTFTIFPKDGIKPSPRDNFLPKLLSGLKAERKTRHCIAKEHDIYDEGEVYDGKEWDKMAEERDKCKIEEENRRIERAYDHSIARLSSFGMATDKLAKKIRRSKYQFVGVVRQPKYDGKKVTWYARKRTSNSKWNARLVHANRDAIWRDMFAKGKIDIFGEYINTGKFLDEGRDEGTEQIPITGRPVIKAKYTIRERCWRNLWNFSPKHFFTDSSGAFWRERRLSTGLYTDGRAVYEAIYRYTDGKNGMKFVSGLDELLKSNAIKENTKNNILKRLKNNSPDVVLEPY